ncbi:MAG: hypothetical protein JSU69_04945, partial [Candidatus Zixiibacteriota bacterium]
QDQILLNILKNNEWERPIYFSLGFGEDVPNYVTDYCRLDGMAWRLVPHESRRRDYSVLEENLLHSLDFSGLDRSSYLDNTGRQTTEMYKAPIRYLVQGYEEDGRQADLDSLSFRFDILRPAVEDSTAAAEDK